MRLCDLQPSQGSKKGRKRVGRGVGSGHGKTSCRGHKGQKARTGGGVKPGFEGGQMPLIRRIPKRGFTNIFQKRFAIVNVGMLDRLQESIITPELLVEKGLVKDIMDGIKVLGDGEVTRAMTVKAHAFSKSAEQKIIQAKGSIEIV
ncbi:MAG: 50S ribosomal protein L15 [Thermodesulfovibrionia bacterium]